MKYIIPFICALFILSSASLDAADKTPSNRSTPLTLSLSTNVAPAPAQVVARVRVERDPRSRALIIEWWSDDGGAGSHLVNLDGDNAAARQDFAIKRMEPGDYVVRAILVRDDGSVIRKEANLVIVGEGNRFRQNPHGTDLLIDASTPGRP